MAEEENKVEAAIAETVEKTAAPAKNGFLDKIICFFLGKNAGSIHAKELKYLSKNIAKLGYKYYNFKQAAVTADFANFLFNVYTVVAPYREFFLVTTEEKYYENAAINFYNTDREREIIAKILPSNIEKLSEKISYDDINEGVRRYYSELKNGFNREKVKKINDLNREIHYLKAFCIFDYYAVLKKFDETLVENSFEKFPSFHNVDADKVKDSLIDFFTMSYQIMGIKDWKTINEFLKIFPNSARISEGKILNVVDIFNEPFEKNIPELLTRLLLGDPKFTYLIRPYLKDVTFPYMDGLLADINSKLEEIKNKKKMKFIERHQNALFGEKPIEYLKKYNPEESEKFEAHGLAGYLHCEPMRNLRQYCKDYFEDSIYKYMEIFTSRGKPYDVEFYTKFNVVYHDISEQFQELLVFDKNLDSNVSSGYKLNFYLTQISNSQDVATALALELEKVNRKAENIYRTCSSLFIEFRQDLEKYMDDRASSKNELMNNWEDVEHALGKSIKEALTPLIASLNEIIGLLEIYKEDD